MSAPRTLTAEPLTTENFSPYGNVIETSAGNKISMNDARFDRFTNLALIDSGDGQTTVSIARSRHESKLPHRVDMLERHPLGTQAFVPMFPFKFLVAVAPAGESVEADDIAAFVTNGRQGINYAQGVWHMPMIALEPDQQFLIIDRMGEGGNCDEHYLDEPFLLDL